MKNFKIALATLLIATMGIAISSFTVKSYNSRAFSVQCYKLQSTVTINTASLNAGNATAHTNFKNVANWASLTQAQVNIDCTTTNRICAICFDPAATGYTLQTALNEIAAAITANPPTFTYAQNAQFTSPTTGVVVTVYEQP